MTRENVGLSIYFDNRMLRILLLGAISGFPWVIIGSALSLWLKDYELSRSTIGWAGLIFAVYSINFFWAPFIDRIRIPFLNQLGHRKSWIIIFQLMIFLSLVIWCFLNPTTNLSVIIFFGLIIAIASASQDISIDALRIEQIKEHEKASMAAGAAIATVGWWSGYKLGGMFTLLIADYFQSLEYVNFWPITFICICSLIIIFNIGLLFIPEEKSNQRSERQTQDQVAIEKRFELDFWKSNGWRLFKLISSFLWSGICLFVLVNSILETIYGSIENENIGFTINIFFYWLITILIGLIYPLTIYFFSWIISSVMSPLVSFFKKNGITISLLIIGFIFLFKIGEAFLGRMSVVFYDDIGFSKSDIAIYSKGLGWITTVFFTFIGGWFVVRSGIVRALFLSGLFMALTNIMFSNMAWNDFFGITIFFSTLRDIFIELEIFNRLFFIFNFLSSDKGLFAISVLLDDIAAAFATVAFVTFISLLVDRTYTATQYALLASIGTFGRTTLASTSGQMIDGLGGDWGIFFIITALMVIPSLILLWLIRNKFNFS